MTNDPEVPHEPVDENTPLLSQQQLDDSDFQAALTKTKHLERDDFPEGGLKAWSVVFGSWCAMVAAFGLLTSSGVMHAWLSEHQLKDHTYGQTGWIFSTFTFLVYFGSIQIGPIFDAYGLKFTLIPGCIGLVTALFLLSISQEYWHYMLSWGVLGGLSASLIFTPATVCIGHWFKQRLALATSLALTAGGIGGALYPFIILTLQSRIGFNASIQIVGLICLLLCLLASTLVTTRLPPNTRAGATIDLLALREPLYLLTTAAIFLLELALFIPVTYIPSYATAHGLAPEQAYALVIYLNLGSVVGRAVTGYVADHVGRFRTMILTSGVTALLTPLWAFADGDTRLITAYAVAFGAASGSFIAVTPVCVAQICLAEDYGKRYGTTYFVVSFGTLVGVPLAGAILDVGGKAPNFEGLIWFSGGVFALGGLGFVAAMGVATKWNFRTKF
ncbi:MFS transporter-like protein 25 [Elsinoe australis]|uniref:MFS transporter-like protein 25 n=1 Tax=Elsinoe australis TaxID=40998 RepID=A0A4V6DVZ4_9PEZI|nr:MFS transporter-like protein 25 [Elsinoe australis]